MTDNGRRHPRMPKNEPGSIVHGPNTFNIKVTDISQSGAAIEFILPQGESRVQFDLGDEINIVSDSLKARKGRVVRHYDGGFALNFDGFKKLGRDDS